MFAYMFLNASIPEKSSIQKLVKKSRVLQALRQMHCGMQGTLCLNSRGRGNINREFP